MAGLLGCAGMKQVVYDMPGGQVLGGGMSGMSITPGQPFELARTDRPMRHGDMSFPQIRRWGEYLVVAWSTQGDNTMGAWFSTDSNGVILRGIRTEIRSPIHSRDDGLTWSVGSPSHFMAALTNVSAATYFLWNSHLPLAQPLFNTIERADGSLIGFNYFIRPVINGRDAVSFQAIGMGAEFRDNKWNQPFDVWFDFPDMDKSETAFAGFLSGWGAELDDGTLLMPIFTKSMFPYKLESPTMSKYSTLLLASTNNGQSFSIRAPIATPKNAPSGNDGPSEAGLVKLQDGTLMCIMRTGGLAGGDRIKDSQSMLVSRSTDGGFTWSRPTALRRGVFPVLRQLQNGVLVCVYGRPGNYIMFSNDNGRTWARTINLTAPQVPTSGYVDMYEVSPGRLLVVYDEREYQPPGEKMWHSSQGYNVVMGRFFDVSVSP